MCFINYQNMEGYRCNICGKRFAREDNLASIGKNTIFINVQIVRKPSQQRIIQICTKVTTMVNLEEGKREQTNLLNPGLQRNDELPRWMTLQKTIELPHMVNKKCKNLIPRQIGIECTFKTWKSEICLIFYKVCVDSFPQ